MILSSNSTQKESNNELKSPFFSTSKRYFSRKLKYHFPREAYLYHGPNSHSEGNPIGEVHNPSLKSPGQDHQWDQKR